MQLSTCQGQPPALAFLHPHFWCLILLDQWYLIPRSPQGCLVSRTRNAWRSLSHQFPGLSLHSFAYLFHPYSFVFNVRCNHVSRAFYPEPRVVNIQGFELLEFSARVLVVNSTSRGTTFPTRALRSRRSERLQAPLIAQILIEEEKIMASLQGSD